MPLLPTATRVPPLLAMALKVSVVPVAALPRVVQVLMSELYTTLPLLPTA